MLKRNYRRKGYKKRNVFSRPRGPILSPRAYTARRGQMRRVYERQNDGDIKLTIGRRLIWIYNNTENEAVIRPGEYIVLEIVSEYENSMGLNIRARPRGKTDSEGGDEVDFKPQDWV